MFERFNNRARQSLVLAQVEARALGHDWLGTEHQLLGLIQLRDGVAYEVLFGLGLTYTDANAGVVELVGSSLDATALASIGIDLDEVRRHIEETFGRGALEAALQPRRPRSATPPFTPRAKHVLELALQEALALGHRYIGTEHVLLGIVREGEGIAAQLLGKVASPDQVRQAVLERLRAVS